MAPQQLVRKNLKISLSVHDEYSILKTVLVHRPGLEIDRLDPSNRQELLFEDIPYLKAMKEEHNNFTRLLRDRGIETIFMSDVLTDILNDNTTRRLVLNEVCGAANQNGMASILNDYFSAERLSSIMFAGITATELENETGFEVAPSDPKKDFFVLKPIPNSYFTRDTAVVIGSKVVICKPHFEARVRESLLVRRVLKHHPRFLLPDTAFLYGARSGEERPFTIEGGDVIVLSRRAIAVGASQRTRSATIRLLAKRLFEEGLADRVYEIPIPAERKYMHLDTVFTVVAPEVVVAYPDVISDIRGIVRYEPYLGDGGEIQPLKIEEKDRFDSILRRELGAEIIVCETGGEYSHKYASREQQADGTNMFAIAPGVVVAYDRTEHTNAALGKILSDTGREGCEIILIKGSELVRGLGGPRCMTMPLQRGAESGK